MKANNQFIKGQSGNPQGRPKGSGLSAQLRAAIEQDAPSIIKAMIEQAKAGDMQAAKALLDRVLPALKPESQAIHLPELVAAPTLADKAKAAIDAGADIVLLDDFSLDDIRAAVTYRGSSDADVKKTQLEVSGGVTLATVRDYAQTGVERISVGALTHSAPALDVSLKVRR